MFYIFDGCMVLTAAMIFKLQVKQTRTGERTLQSLKKIVTRPALILYFLVALFGMGWGIQDSYLAVYLQQVMKLTPFQRSEYTLNRIRWSN